MPLFLTEYLTNCCRRDGSGPIASAIYTLRRLLFTY